MKMIMENIEHGNSGGILSKPMLSLSFKEVLGNNYPVKSLEQLYDRKWSLRLTK